MPELPYPQHLEQLIMATESLRTPESTRECDDIIAEVKTLINAIPSPIVFAHLDKIAGRINYLATDVCARDTIIPEKDS